ncbi:hypothetical protein OAM25_02505 [Gammaproteobacteria bacterium]|nr:hypothetical protein [Gammaproteobacteria bacterium]
MNKTILINGAIRDTSELHLILDYILYHIDRNKVEIDVLVSTWKNDINQHNKFIRYFHKRNVKFIGSPELDITGPANIYRQWRTIEAGLNYIDDDKLVLKGRTDKFLLRKDIIRSFIESKFQSNCLDQLSKHTLAVEHFSTSLPFMAKDMIFLGTVSAIRKILHFSVRTKYLADHIYNGIGPECFLWLELASNNNILMQLVQNTDLRFVSNDIIEKGLPLAIKESKKDIIYLYNEWIKTFDENLCFISDVLQCKEVEPFLVNEGSYKYEIGDRSSYEQVKLLISKESPVQITLSDIGIEKKYFTDDKAQEDEDIEHPFKDIKQEIRDDDITANIVLIRDKIIKKELYSANPDTASLKDALHWNIRQRHRDTIDMVYDWIEKNDSRKLLYISKEDIVFVIERSFDFFCFSNDFESIDKSILNFTKYFKSSASLSTRVAEHFFRINKKLRALYWFIKSYRIKNDSLGVNHGLGCTLLDLGLPGFACIFLRKAYAIAPHDQTVIFTSFRANLKSKNFKESNMYKGLLKGQLYTEAVKIDNMTNTSS